MHRKLLFIALCTVCLLSADPAVALTPAAPPIVIDRDFQQIPMGKRVDILIDREGELTIDDIVSSGNSQAGEWIRSEAHAPGFGFSSSVYWVRFTIVNPTDNDRDVYLHQQYPLIDFLDLYVHDAGGRLLREIKTGDHYPFSHRPYPYHDFVFPLTIPSQSSNICYFRYQTTSAVIMSLVARTPDNFVTATMQENAFLWLFNGGFFIMFAFNLLVFIGSRKIAHLFYVLYIGAFLLLLMALSGQAYQYLWPQAVWWANYCIPILISLIIIGMVQFADMTIDTSHLAPRLRIPLTVLTWLSVAVIVLTVISSNYRFGIISSTLITGIACLYGAWYNVYCAFSPRLRSREAFFIIISFEVFLFGILLYVLKTYGVLPENTVTGYSIQLSAMAQVVLLSLIFPDQLNRLQKRLTHMNIHLDDLVKKRTVQLEVAQSQLVDTAHKAGMADVARDTMHNVGNIINSVRTSVYQLKQLTASRFILSFKNANTILRENVDTIDDFIASDPKGKKLLAYYLEIEHVGDEECRRMAETVDRLFVKIDEIAAVISSQQAYVNGLALTEYHKVEDVAEEVLLMQKEALTKENVTIDKSYAGTPPVPVQKIKLVHVIGTLLSNARDAMMEMPEGRKRIFLTSRVTDSTVFFSIRDNGPAIPEDQLQTIFFQGRSESIGNRTGVGLHNSANYIAEMGGSIRAENDIDGGVAFMVAFPLPPTASSVAEKKIQ
ncbi:MAG: sensor histidine kinase [Thermodesulfobacteriota bacterium]|nr:sensor histidine kinase [Thermodesulfobacteriota bacterium]